MRIRRISQGLSAALVVLGLGLGPGLGLLPGTAWAQGDLYTVQDISVDVTDEDAASARVAALESGHRQALAILLTRIAPAQEVLALPELSAEEITEMVQEFSVANERTSNVRYLAELTFRFNPDAVRQYLGNNDIPFAELRSEPLLVLPVFGGRRSALLWRNPNPWRLVWAGRRLDNELVPMIVPLGDLEDIATIDGLQALDVNADRLEAIARRYDARQVLIAQLVLSGSVDRGQARAEVFARRYGGTEQRRPVFLSFNQGAEEGRDDFLSRVADGLIAEVRDQWKIANLRRFGEQNRLLVTVPVSSLAEWLEVKQRLADVAAVVDSHLAYMTRESVDLLITYVGNEDQLTRALAQKDLTLTPDVNQGWWELSLNTALPPATGQPPSDE